MNRFLTASAALTTLILASCSSPFESSSKRPVFLGFERNVTGDQTLVVASNTDGPLVWSLASGDGPALIDSIDDVTASVRVAVAGDYRIRASDPSGKMKPGTVNLSFDGSTWSLQAEIDDSGAGQAATPVGLLWLAAGDAVIASRNAQTGEVVNFAHLLVPAHEVHVQIGNAP